MAIPRTWHTREPWNRPILSTRMRDLKLRDIWAIRARLQLRSKIQNLALFDLAFDSKLRTCDLVKPRVSDASHWAMMALLTMVMQQRTRRPVQSGITRMTRQHARIVHRWVEEIGLDAGSCETHPKCRTKASLTCRRTENLRAVQLLLGHTRLERIARYLWVEVDDALEVAERTDA